MKPTLATALTRIFLPLLFASGFIAEASAHGETGWNDFTIENKNRSIESSIQQVKKVIGDIVLQRRDVDRWPDPELLRLRDSLVQLKEEVDELLDHFTEDGVHLQLRSSLREHPNAGRSVAGSHAIEVGIELLDHIASLEDPAAFEEELHTAGIGAYMYDLMDSHVTTMSLYRALAEVSD